MDGVVHAVRLEASGTRKTVHALHRLIHQHLYCAILCKGR